MLDWIRLVFALGILTYTAWLDIRARRAPDWPWLLLAAVGTVLIIVQFWNTPQRPLLLLLFSSWSIFLILIVGRPAIADLMDGNKVDLAVSALYLTSIITAAYLALNYPPSLDDPVTNYLWIQPILILVLLGLFHLGMIAGGADAKALMCISFLWPIVPRIPFGPQMIFPVAVGVLVTTTALLLALPITYKLRNIFRGSWGPPSWFGYRLSLDEARGKKWIWLIDRPVIGDLELGGKELPAVELELAILAFDGVEDVEAAVVDEGLEIRVVGDLGNDLERQISDASKLWLSLDGIPQIEYTVTSVEKLDSKAPRIEQVYWHPWKGEKFKDLHLSVMERMGIDQVWVTPQIPMLVPLVPALLVTILFGSPVEWLLTALIGPGG